METYIYVSSLDYYIQISNIEFFRFVQEAYDHTWTITVLCRFEEDGLFYINFYAELNHIKKEIGYICASEFYKE